MKVSSEGGWSQDGDALKDKSGQCPQVSWGNDGQFFLVDWSLQKYRGNGVLKGAQGKVSLCHVGEMLVAELGT